MRPKNDKTGGLDLSIVIPVYFNRDTVRKTFEAIYECVIKKNGELSCEIIFVDDGSLDSSLEEILRIWEENRGLVRVIKFSRNFGQVNAILAGYKHAKGKCIVNISADLQDPPELINQMLKHHYDEGWQIVVATRSEREEPFLRRLTSGLFYRLMKRLSFPNMPLGGFDYVLIDRSIRDVLLMNQEANSFWQGQLLWTGYETKFIPYIRRKREVGESKWTFAKKLKYMIDGTMSYSYLPLRLMSIVGSGVSVLGFLYAVVIVFARIFGDVPFKGWAPIMVLILVLSGVQMLMLGVIGEYLWRTLDQARNRQPYIIEKIYD